MLTLDQLLQKLWMDYSSMNQQAGAIHRALEKRGEKVVNDHLAFRTLNLSKVGIDVLAEPFLKFGYKDASGKGYFFKEKKLFARHYEHSDSNQPKVFISELLVEEFSPTLQKTVKDMIDQVPDKLTQTEDFLISGFAWKPVSWQVYQDLLKESEYAAWVAAFGFRVNHFTVSYNALTSFKDFPDLNGFVKGAGFSLNAAGGEIKGSKDVYLEQSSTLAHPVEVQFSDRKAVIPACYYEFARRYPMPNGKLFQAFLPDSADKIFESTNFRTI
ncbi:MAG: DUF1338 domain-containing protein [Candidatus Omnitrophica bacterium]|nr:DUF1338 domain-containing protein [Candidatus Omnitrophota bacterium]